MKDKDKFVFDDLVPQKIEVSPEVFDEFKEMLDCEPKLIPEIAELMSRPSRIKRD